MPASATIDWLILTAANAAQAKGYEAQLAARESAGALPGVRRWRVIPDPGGRRVGSGGSTLWVLYEIARELRALKPGAASLRELFDGQRVLVIHSGGDSKRLTAYAAQGKVFTPLPCDAPGTPRRSAALFDLILADLARLATPDAGHVLLAAGDALLTFDHADVDFDRPGVVGAAFPGPVERGVQHGVYVLDDRGRVVHFLQKPTPEHARQKGAVDSVGRVLIDSGLVGLDPATAERWLAMAGVALPRRRGAPPVIKPGILRDLTQGRSPDIDLYEQLLIALSARLSRQAYLRMMAGSHTGAADDAAHARRLGAIYDALHRQPFHACVLSYCDFFHVGANRDLLTHVATLGRTAKAYGFANRDRAAVADRAAADSAFIYNTILHNEQVRAGDGVFIEACCTSRPLDLPGPNVLVGLPPDARRTVKLPPGTGLVCLPTPRGGWAAVAFGIRDDFKTPRARGGTFANEPLDRLLERYELTPDAVWDEADPAAQTLWNAKLWTLGPVDTALGHAMALVGQRKPAAKQRAAWRRARRVSMAELLTRVDHGRLLAHRQEIQRRVEIERLDERLEADPWLPARDVAAMLRRTEEARVALDAVRGLLGRTQAPPARARLLRLAGEIVDAYPAARGADRTDFTRAAMSAVMDAVGGGAAASGDIRPAAVLPDQVVWVTAPVRLDFHGGWSDTPPICTECGGTVLNAAVTLNDHYPVQVIAKLTAQPRITLNSIDLGHSVTFTNARDVEGPIDPTQWWALPKAALRLSGVLPQDGRTSLKRRLEAFGGGLDLTIFSALPKGSGLGTSSVLGAAMLACLARILGQTESLEFLSARTLRLEQLMTTGGGWQDQVGAIFGGVKLIRTRPGVDQRPAVQWARFEPDANPDLANRCLLYFTGIQRMARDILQKVVGRYLLRDPAALDILRRLKAGAEQMKTDLDAGDADAFARGIEEYWALKRALDPGSTNPRIEALLKPVNRYLDARLLLGAGGGGFVFMIAKDPGAAQKVRTLLDKYPPNPLARFFDFNVNRRGLGVTVL